MSLGLLIARLVLGLAMAAHGTQKLFGWFGGYGRQGTAGYLEGAGFRPGILFVWALGLGEVGSGLLMALGLLGPVGPALMISINCSRSTGCSTNSRTLRRVYIPSRRSIRYGFTCSTNLP